jgi:hypothetical protein
MSSDAPPVADHVQAATPEEEKAAEAARANAPLMVTPEGSFDKAAFSPLLLPRDLQGLKDLAGMRSGEAWKDRQLRHALKDIIPGCMFHYGRDMPLDQALDTVMAGSSTPVQLIDSRYLVVSGANGPYLAGRGFVWIDLQDGLGLGGFFFHPTNGEPTPTVAVFSRQVNDGLLAESEMPPAFLIELANWSARDSIPAVATQYFLTGGNQRVLFEHDEDFCAPANEGMLPLGSDCEQMNADAADVDEVAAYYLDQVNYKTNATAWMIGPDQRDFLVVRDRTCGGVVDPLACRIRVTREHTRVILRKAKIRR